jgi:hypothetical protein
VLRSSSIGADRKEVVATHKIDVDDEVYAHLERSAKPLVDTPNSVLRRLLDLDRKEPAPATSRRQTPPLAQLVATGKLTVGQRLTWRRRNLGTEYTAFVTEDGKLRLEDGTIYDSPSGACFAAAGINVNGWSTWRTTDDISLQSLRTPS